jgi:hypothetical protein
MRASPITRQRQRRHSKSPSKYVPRQGAREIERRRRQIERGQLKVENGLSRPQIDPPGEA